MEPNAQVRFSPPRATDGGLTPALITAWVGVLFAGAIFGFFYAWVCSTMWGLDEADPRVAIAAMQAMNASVRNAVFFPAFFLTPVVLGLAAALAWRERRRVSSRLLLAAAAVYLLGGLILTMTVNVPMNEALGDVAVPSDLDEARMVWRDYSGRWQLFNQLRTVASGVSLALASAALVLLHRRSGHEADR
ncbi:anthrone oxygenase family protein [uncultured Nocardioides sp.]|uniref:anthrone oxygenase family protein n=1 Tax=uncultured Nocardioides sp. TaxID=198441 RepID=UPI002607641E|nr:anthrone oxygenase family protein [uncultured Nocardioides sp.]MDP3969748.1 DUF1772 domain-containing protein [Nocardioides sp.]